MSKDRIYFNQFPNPTLGVEAELFTVSKDTFHLCPGAREILHDFRNGVHVKGDLREYIVEVSTGICNNMIKIRSDLINKIGEIQKIANNANTGLISSIGTHPFACWKGQW